MDIWSIGQLIGGVLLSIGYIPQITQILKTKSAKGLNTASLTMVFIGISLMEPYAINLVIHGNGIMFLITNTMATAFSGIMLLLRLIYKEPKTLKSIKKWPYY